MIPSNIADPVERLVGYIVERYCAQLAKEAGEPWSSWTADPVIRSVFLCCVRREDDRTTRWLAKNWRAPHQDDPDVWHAMLVARFINLPAMLDAVGVALPWDNGDHLWQTYVYRRDRDLPVWGAAYVIPAISSEPGRNKMRALIADVFNPLWEARDRVRPRPGDRLQDFADRLGAFRGMGSFFVGQVLADTKYCEPLRNAPDWWDFALSGPGSRRGLNRVLGHHPDAPWAEQNWLYALRRLRDLVMPRLVDIGIGRLCLQDLQNNLCEFSKFETVRLGGRAKRHYRPPAVGRGFFFDPSTIPSAAG
jgi:hypothetical protein